MCMGTKAENWCHRLIRLRHGILCELAFCLCICASRCIKTEWRTVDMASAAYLLVLKTYWSRSWLQGRRTRGGCGCFNTHTFFQWEGSTPTPFLQIFCSFTQTHHYRRSVSLAALCLLAAELPPLFCRWFKHDTGFGTDWLMIGCSALCPASLSVLDLLFSSCWWNGNYRKIPNNSRGVYLFQSLKRPGVYLGQVFNSLLTKIRDENVTNFSSFSVNSLASFWAIFVLCKWSFCGGGNKPTSTRSKLLISAVTHGGAHLFLHRPDHFVGHSIMACPSADNSSPHVYLRLLTSLLYPSTSQPDPLWVYRETSSGCFSRVFLCIFYARKFEFQVVLFIFLLHQSHGDHKCETDWQKAAHYVKKAKRKNVQCQWSRLLPWFFRKINKSDSAFIWNRRLFTQIYTCTRRLNGTLRVTETQLLLGNIL